MKLFGILRFITGVLIAIALLFAGGAVAARYIITRLTAPPAKPIFAEEQVSPSVESTEPTDSAPASQQNNTPTSEVRATSDDDPVQVFTDPVEPEPEVFEVESANTDTDVDADLDADARITQPIGMVLRQGPSQDTTQIGSLYYNDEVIVLGTSADGEWQNVRLPGSGVEGWIKAGNTDSLN